MPDPIPFIARPSDVDVLKNLWEDCKRGNPHVLRLQAPFGGGRRAVSSEFFRSVAAAEEAVLWRVNCVDQENGLQWLVRMYGALVANLTQDALTRGKVEMLLNAQLPSQPKRVQGWYQAFVTTLKEAKTDKEKGQVKLQLPKDNPLIALVEVVVGIAKKQPVALEIQNAQAVNSLALSAFVEALLSEARDQGSKVFVVLFDEEPSDVTKAMYPMPLLDLYDRVQGIDAHKIAPWGADEVGRYLSSRSLDTRNAGRIAEIARGRPGFVAEVVDLLQEQNRLGTDLDGVTLASLTPVEPDPEELEAPEGPPKEGERTHAGVEHAGQICFLAALLGQAFPSSLVADMGNYDRDSVDDMLDALDGLFEEVHFQKEMDTWIYKFRRGSFREGILEANATDAGRELARRVGLFLERYLVPRGYGFIAKTAKVYAENGALGRAHHLRAIGLTNDAADVWGLAYDVLKYFDELSWPDALRRTVYVNLIDHLIVEGPIPAAEQVHTDITQWAAEKADKDLTAWLLFAGSRLDLRRQDLFRARERANDSLKLFEVLENKARVAEIHNHLATIELQDGNPNAALEEVEKAIEAAKVDGPEGKPALPPGILAHAEQIRGHVKRRSDPKGAAEHFHRANEVAGQTGMAALALDSGLSFGEALLASGQTRDARDALRQVVGIAQQLRNAVRERHACELLAQAEAGLKDWNAATAAGTRALQLSQALQFENALPVDLYNLGFFHFFNEKPREAITFFKQSEARIGRLGKHPIVKELYYFMGLAHMKAGNLDDAKQSLQTGLSHAQENQDHIKVVSCFDNLAGIAHKQGDDGEATRLLDQAIELAAQKGLKEQRKALKKKLDGLQAH